MCRRYRWCCRAVRSDTAAAARNRYDGPCIEWQVKALGVCHADMTAQIVTV